jgi:hypothetical protein
MNLPSMNFLPANFLRSLAADLRERQVLPAVVVLALLAIGIPVYATIELAKSPTPVTINPAPVDVTPPHGAPAPGQALAAVETAQSQHYTVYKGTEPNPFRANTSGAPAASSKTSSSASKSTSVTTPPKATTPTKKITTVTPTPKSESAPTKLSDDEAYTIDGVSTYGSETDTLDDIQRLTPLPANVDAEIVFLGVTHHGEKAVFLLTDAVAAQLTASSSAKCLPSSSDCQVIELELGQQLQLKPTSASLATFTFKLSAIRATTYASSSAARSVRTSASAAGQQIVSQSTSTALASFVYDAGTGALLYEPGASPGAPGATGATGATG